ncbi:hypothetical protein Tco_0014640 [Tanacetum coccineum]
MLYTNLPLLRAPWIRYIFVILLGLLKPFVDFLLTGSSPPRQESHLERARVRHQNEKTGSEKIEKVGYTVMKPSGDDTFDSMLVGYKMELNTDEVGT